VVPTAETRAARSDPAAPSSRSRRRGRFARAGRRTNLALLVLLIGAFASGWVAFGFGTPGPSTVSTVAHGLLGLGVVVMTPWKSVVIRRAIALRLASLALLAVILTCLTAGFVEVFVGFRVTAPISAIQLHVGAAVVLVPLVGLHVLRHRRQTPRRTDLSRRRLLVTGGFAAAIAAGYTALEGIGRLTHSPAASRVATGSHRLASAEVPATIWLLDQVPELANDHRVAVAGQPMSPSDLATQATAVRARLDCTSGWYADLTWAAVPLSALIPADRLAAAASIVVTSVTGYRRRFPPDQAGVLYLAVGCEGQPLRTETGAPVRLVAPHRRGFWWVKWVASVELSDEPPWAQSPFPLQ
jgi:Oxidoreductase molybdopterin binding domain